MKKFLFIVFTFLLLFVSILVVTEIILQLTWDGLPEYSEKPNPDKLSYSKVPYQDVGYVLEKNKKISKFGLSTNNDGFRIDPSIKKEKSPGTLRIALLGDSIVFGHRTPTYATISANLDKLFSKVQLKSYKRTETLNFGIGGHNMNQYLGVFKHYAIKYNPDIVIIGLTIFNDFDGTGYVHLGGQALAAIPEYSITGYNCDFQAPSKWIRKSMVAWLVYQNFFAKKQRVAAGWAKARKDGKPSKVLLASRNRTDEIWEEVEKEIAEIKKLAENHNIKLLFLLFPASEQVFHDDIKPDTQAIIKDILSAKGIASIDFYNEFVKFQKATNFEPFKDYNSHPSNNMHRVIAADCRDFILENFIKLKNDDFSGRIDIGSANDAKYLTFGFANRRKDGNETYRVLGSNHGRISFTTSGGRFSSLIIRMASCWNGKPITVTIALNGKTIGSTTVNDSFTDYEFPVSIKPYSGQLNSLDIWTDHAYPEKPVKATLFTKQVLKSVKISNITLQ